VLSECRKADEQIIIADYRRVREYRKEKLDDISGWLGELICSSKESRA